MSKEYREKAKKQTKQGRVTIAQNPKKTSVMIDAQGNEIDRSLFKRIINK